MALDNTIVWCFSPDLGETHEIGDCAHTTVDNKTRNPAGTRFDPADDSLAEIRRALTQYFPLTVTQAEEILSIERSAIDAAWTDKAALILICIHRSFAGANETLLPALAKARLRKLRNGDPQLGKPRP